MTTTVQRILHVLTIAVSITTLAAGLVPPKYAPVVLLMQGVISDTIRQIASRYNPDGTPASVPYLPTK